MYDIIIIGAGPAGISASLYAKRANASVAVLYHGKTSLENAEKIDNYYGFPGGINGKELYENGIKQAKELGIEINETEVIQIENLGNTFNIKTDNGEFETRSIILSTGNKKIKPKIKGLDEFEGKGISYCATCDAFFYKNKKVAVIGNGKFAINEANELLPIVNEVKILSNGLEPPECRFAGNTNKIKKIIGEQRVSKIEFEDGSIIDIDGIFIAMGIAGAGDFAKTLGIIQQDDNIIVDNNMKTNIDGIFACGDATGGRYQVCKAVYQGAEAGIAAVNYIRKMKGE